MSFDRLHAQLRTIIDRGPAMSNLRLGAVNLEPKDVAFVRALVRLFAHTEKLSWSFADKGPYHAVVADPGARTAHPGFFAAFEGVVLTLVAPPGAAAVDTVAYPIRAHQFRDWLKLRQETLLDLLYRAETPVVTLSGAQAATSTLAGRRFKLRRWPGAHLLRADPLALRMSTLMSRNALSIAQLAGLTGHPEEACRRFIRVLQEATLLVELVELVEPADAGAAARTRKVGQGGPDETDEAAGHAEQAAPVRVGLMASLRRHLGI